MAAAVAGCAQQSAVRFASSKEYFPESIYGRASPRLVADGPIPHGGGQYLVGHPYVVAGRLYVPRIMNRSYSEVGMASWYGDAFHGRRTANGEIYDKNGITAAHPTMPLPSYARITNTTNGRSMIVRVNDRGPYHPGRVMDVSSRVADALDFKRYGTAHVRVDYVGPASLGGSDDRELLATLRTDGQPASMDGSPDAMVASAGASLPFGSLLRHARSALSAAAPMQKPRPPGPREASVVAEAVPEPRAIPERTAYGRVDAPLPPRRSTGSATSVGVKAPKIRQASASYYAPNDSWRRGGAPLGKLPSRDAGGGARDDE